jgi:uncharacterized protein YecT (DUF1311 family)
MRRFILPLIVLALATISARAEVTTFGSFKHSTDVPGVLVLAGPVTPASVSDFRKALRAVDVKTLFLLSPGGNVQAGLELSAILNDRRISTVIPPNQDCASACAFLFVAGEKRRAYGRLGVHQFTSNGASGSGEASAQQVTAEIIDYLKEYKVPPQFLVRMLETPPDQIYWFDVVELRSHGIETLSTFPRELERFSAVPELSEQIVVNTPVATQPAPQPQTAVTPTPQVSGAVRPSFDCTKAGNATEFAICGNAEIARMDLVMARRYVSLRGSLDTNGAANLRSSQRAWLTNRNRCGGDTNCLALLYQTRLRELGL